MGKKSKSAKKKSSAINNNGGGCNKRKNKLAADPFGAKPNTNNADSFQSIYQVYKTATLRFKERLASLVGPSTFDLERVQSFLDAADYVKDNDVPVDDVLLRNLRLAIRVRKKYSKQLVNGGDEGHAYFLLVLIYCLRVLKQCKNQGSSGTKEESSDNGDHEMPQRDQASFINRFGALSVDGYHQGQAESDSEDDDDEAPVARPQPPSKEYSYSDLVSFPDRAKCLFLLDTMAHHACKATLGMKNLKETMRMEARGEYPTDSVICELMCLGALAKSIMLDVKDTEDTLYVECPDLCESPYRVLACCFMSPFINTVSNNVREHSPLAKNFKDEHTLAYFGDVIEAVLRSRAKDAYEISTKFSRRWKLPEHWVGKNRWLTDVAVRMTLKNVATAAEKEMYQSFRSSGAVEQKLYDDSAEWLLEDDTWKSIGGENSILNTMRLLDMFGSSFDDSGHGPQVFEQLLPHIFHRRPEWDEDKNPASSIRGCMDSVLMKILNLLMDTNWRPDGIDLPAEKTMLPLVSFIRKWIRTELKQTPFALTFALHLVLMSMFELQGDGDFHRIGSMAKNACRKFTAQAEEHLKLGIPCNPRREHCLKFIIDTKRVSEIHDDFDSSKAGPLISLADFDLLFWNPLSAGMFLGYNSIYLSLEGGLAGIATTQDFHAVLHLYNALKSCGLVDEDLPMLADFDEYFTMSKYVWNGWKEKPQQGKFTYRLHLSVGATNEVAIWKQDMARYKHEGGEKPADMPKVSVSTFLNTRKTSKRVATSIDPTEVSKTFKRLCLCDFGDLEEELRDPYVPKHLKIDPTDPSPMPLQIQDAKIFLVFKAFMSECNIRLIKYNMVAAGTIFSQFLFETFHPDKNENIARFQARGDLPCDNPGDIRTLINIRITEEILADLDYNHDRKYAYLGEAFEIFFNNLDMDRVYLW